MDGDPSMQSMRPVDMSNHASPPSGSAAPGSAAEAVHGAAGAALEAAQAGQHAQVDMSDLDGPPSDGAAPGSAAEEVQGAVGGALEAAEPGQAASLAEADSSPPAKRRRQQHNYAKVAEQGFSSPQLGSSSGATKPRPPAGKGRPIGRRGGGGSAAQGSPPLALASTKPRRLAAPGAATRPTEEAHQAKKDADKEGTKAAYEHKEKMINFFLEHLEKFDAEKRYFNPDFGTNLADEEKGPLLATNMLRWVGDEAPHFYENATELYNRRKPKPKTLAWGFVQSFHSALQKRYEDDRKLANPGRATAVKKLLNFVSYKDQYNSIRNSLYRKGSVDTVGPDPQVGTIADTYSFEEYREGMLKLLLDSSLPAARAASDFIFMHSSVGRGDDMTLLKLSHLLLFNMACIGPCPFFVLAALLKGGKTQETGAKGYKGVPRNQDLVVCPWRAMAFYFFRRFVKSGEEFPDPLDKEEWRLRALWAKTTNPNESWTYNDKNRTVHGIFRYISRMHSVVHAFRKGGARQLQEAGLSHEVIGQLGMWLTTAMVKSYLACFPPDAMLAQAGFSQAAAKKDFDMFWHERFTLVVPRELVDHFFPFLVQFEARMAQMAPDVLRNEVSVPRMRHVLHGLGIGGVQDCLWMAADENNKEYLETPEVQHMLQHPEFVKRVEAVKEAKRIGFWVGRKPMTAKELVLHLATLHLMPQEAARCLMADGLAQQLNQPATNVPGLQQAQEDQLEQLMAAPPPVCDTDAAGPEDDNGVAALLEALSPSRSNRSNAAPTREAIAPRQLDMDAAWAVQDGEAALVGTTASPTIEQQQQPQLGSGGAALGPVMPSHEPQYQPQQQHSLAASGANSLLPSQQQQQRQQPQLGGGGAALGPAVPLHVPQYQPQQQHSLAAPGANSLLPSQLQQQQQQQQPQLGGGGAALGPAVPSHVPQYQPQQQHSLAAPGADSLLPSQLQQQLWGNGTAVGAVPPLMQVLQQQVPMHQPPLVPAAAQHMLAPQFLAEQRLSYAAPFAEIVPSVLSNAPAYGHYQPHIGHILGAAASGQRLLQAPYIQQRQYQQQQYQQQQYQQQQQLAVSGGLTYTTAADGSFSYGMPGGIFVPQDGIRAPQGMTSGVPAQKMGSVEAPQQQKKGAGSRRDMSGPRRQLPTLSYFDSTGGFVKIWNWWAVEVDGGGLTRAEKEEQQLRLRPAEIPEWRKDIKKQRFSEFKKLVDLITEEAQREQQITGRAVSHLMAARKLEKERETAKKGKKQGFTAMLKQMQAAARSKRNDSGGAEGDLVPSGEEDGE